MNDLFQERYRAPSIHTIKPMIITTNITLSAMQKATDLDDRRIYDRILEVRVPILFNGENFRKGNAAENLKQAAELLKSPLS